MIRFLVNLIIFALLFYATWLFFPETFAVIVGWIAKLFELVKELVLKLVDYVSHLGKTPATPEAPKTLFWH